MNLADAQFNGKRREMIDRMYKELYEEGGTGGETNVLDKIQRLEGSVSSLIAKVEEIERKIDKPQLFDDEYIKRLIDDAIRNHVSLDHNANGLPEISRQNIEALRYDIMEHLRQEFNMFLRQKVERGNLYIGFNDVDSYY